jgi:penicillin-binding protein-related factor A (putative recombinase)
MKEHYVGVYVGIVLEFHTKENKKDKRYYTASLPSLKR